MEDTYYVTRMFFADPGLNYCVVDGLSLEEAQEHCQDPDTSSSTCTDEDTLLRMKEYAGDSPWFDGYDKETFSEDEFDEQYEAYYESDPTFAI